MIGLIVGAAVLGLFIAAMEKGDFPGWGKMVFCVLVAVISAAIVNALLPPEAFAVGLACGALCAGCAISATRGMDVKRASIAAGIYLLLQTTVSTVFYFGGK